MLESRGAVIVISLIWGLGLALLFRKACTNDQCAIIKVPPEFYTSKQIIYDRNNRCYKLTQYSSPCAE